MLKHSPGMEARLRTMPLFCMETALKLLLWSDVVYECVVEQDGTLGPPKQVGRVGNDLKGEGASTVHQGQGCCLSSSIAPV